MTIAVRTRPTLADAEFLTGPYESGVEVEIDEFSTERRRTAARDQFFELAFDFRQALEELAREYTEFFWALLDGRWAMVVRLLNKWEDEWPSCGFRHLAQQVESVTINAIDHF